MSEPGARRWLAEALATRDLDRLEPNMAAAGERVNDSRRHVVSARAIADTDATLAIAACHDAIRKAITAHMSAQGYRPKRGEGAHRIVLEYARHLLSDVISAETLTDADAIRRDRGLMEYGDFAAAKIDAEHVRWATSVAERVVDAVAAELAGRAKRFRGTAQ